MSYCSGILTVVFSFLVELVISEMNCGIHGHVLSGGLFKEYSDQKKMEQIVMPLIEVMERLKIKRITK